MKIINTETETKLIFAMKELSNPSYELLKLLNILDLKISDLRKLDK